MISAIGLATVMVGDQLEAGIRDPGAVNYWPIAGALILLVAAAFAVRKWFFNDKAVHAQ